MNSLVSVIIPLYNLSGVMSSCIDSVLAQTYGNMEVILVDDGSTDDTLSICESYVTRDGRVRVVHQNNAGVSAARNAGLELASGEFVAFVDGDDIIAPFYIEKLIDALSDNVLSMCMHERIHDYDYKFTNTDVSFGKLPAEECAKRLLSGNFPVCVWGGIFLRRLIGNLRFPVGIRNNEDKYFLYAYLLRNESGSVAFTNQKMYGYIVRDGSATRSVWNGSKDIIKMADAIYDLTVQQHEHWADIALSNQIAARLSVLKTIVKSKAVTQKAQSEFVAIRNEILTRGIPKTASRPVRFEYQVLKLGKVPYKCLTKMYYGIMSDNRRMARNEHNSIQKT